MIINFCIKYPIHLISFNAYTILHMYKSVNLLEYELYHRKCDLLLQETEIRFAGFLDVMGNLIAGGFREGVMPLNDESERLKLHMETLLRVKTEQDFDYDLETVEYSIS